MRLAAAVFLVATSCAPAQTAPGGGSPGGGSLGNDVAYSQDGGALAHGDYACRIQDGGYDYPPFRCVVHASGNRTILEKVEGSVRFRGVVAPTRDGFRLDGELFCPWGDCTEAVHAEFRPAGGGTYVAAVQPADARRDRMLITLAPAASYGGQRYGGYGYGGPGYGGYGYGGTPHR